ncbi:STY4534 family ICE replication protein [Pasteurellaceae bacterium LIM206]|nr:STY4534 family ICE replication protein [Pasteurellaceae bacterium LIM206]
MSNQDQAQTPVQQAKPTYFNLHTSGIGYLNDIREVTPKKGPTFLACRVSALVGESASLEYRYFDMNVKGEATETLIRKCQQAVADKRKVLIAFTMSDLRYETFTYSKDGEYHKKGDTGVTLKGRLIRIDLIKIDGEVKFKAPVKQQNAEQAPQEQTDNGENQ